MKFFHRQPKTPVREYDLTVWRPVIRCSICTGEQTAGMKNTETGKFEELMLIRNGDDLDEYCRTCHVSPEEIRREY